MSFEQQELTQAHGKKIAKSLTFCLWAIFAAGLLVQAAAPRLKIENHAFVMPPSAMMQGAVIRPDRLVLRERRMQLASGVLTVGGSLALAFYYRRRLVVALRGEL
ncbi:MAG TPA: hypothetical protein VGM18_04700 [Candidatus Sulfotelmatobacter sp.]